MINDPQKRLSNKAAHPLLLDILSDHELNSIIEKCSSSDKAEIEIKISQQGKELFLARKRQFEAPCPCNQHSTPTCTHSTDADGKAICR